MLIWWVGLLLCIEIKIVVSDKGRQVGYSFVVKAMMLVNGLVVVVTTHRRLLLMQVLLSVIVTEKWLCLLSFVSSNSG